MIENDKIVHRMSLRQKLELLISSKAYSNSPVDDYEFPSIVFNKNHTMLKKDHKATAFPSDEMLSYSWNDELVENVSRAKYEENVFFDKNGLYLFSPKEINEFSCDSYFKGRMISSLVKGVLDVDGYVAIEKVPPIEDLVQEMENELLPLDCIYDNSSVNYIIVHSLQDVCYLVDNKKYKGKILAFASSSLEVCRMLTKGASLIFVNEEKYEQIIEEVEVIVRAYDYAKQKLDNKGIDLNTFKALEEEGRILSFDTVQERCNNMINFYLEYSKFINLKNDSSSSPYSLNEHDDLAYESMVEGITLLKNSKNVLPLKIKDRVALIGEPFANKDYFLESFENEPTSFTLPFDEITKYSEINYVGFAHGYLKGYESPEILLNKACSLANLSNVNLLFIWNYKNENKLDESQLRLIDELHRTRSKIVLILISKVQVELSFLGKISALLYCNDVSQAFSKAVLDILCGKKAPGGFLPHPYFEDGIQQTNEIAEYFKTNKKPIFPVGYGLSYGNFEYQALEVNEKGVKFTIKNSGEHDGYCLSLIFVSKEKKTDNLLDNELLRGYKKLFIPKGESVKVFIPFDEYTFRSFIKEKNSYGIRGGKYKVSIRQNSEKEVLSGVIKLSPYYDPKYNYNNKFEKAQFYSEDYLDTFIESSQKPSKKGLNFGLKLTIIILTFIYINAFLVLMLVSNFETSVNNKGLTIFLIILLILSNSLLIWRLVKTIIFKVKKVEISSSSSLFTLIDDVETFEEVDKIHFKIVNKKKEELEGEEFIVRKPIQDKEDEVTNVVEEEQKEEIKEEKEKEIKEETNEEVTKEETNEVTQENELTEETEVSEQDIALLEQEEMKLAEEQGNLNVEENEEEEIVEYDDESSLSQIASNFVSYALSRGIVVELSSAREILASIAGYKIIFMNSKLKDVLDDFIVVINDFLADKAQSYICDEKWVSSFSLHWKKNEEGKYEFTPFIYSVIKANKLKNNLNIAVLKNVNFQNFASYFKDYLEYANSPSLEHKVLVSNNNIISLPKNLTFICVPQEDEYINGLSEEITSSATFIEPLIRKSESEEEFSGEMSYLSFTYLEELIHEALKVSYLDEDCWKKIDNFEHDINQIAPFVIENKTVLQIERFASIYIGCGGDVSDCLDSVLATKIIPLVKCLDYFKQNGTEKELVELVRKNFGEDNTSRAVRVINSTLSLQGEEEQE